MLILRVFIRDILYKFLLSDLKDRNSNVSTRKKKFIYFLNLNLKLYYKIKVNYLKQKEELLKKENEIL